MANMKEDILEIADGEEILGVVISKTRSGYAWSDDEADSPIAEKLTPWNEAAPYLDYGYDDGYGGQDCHSIYAWTPSRVLFVSEYDGSTCVKSIPRDMQDCVPESI